jgi:hypothetical protein
MRAYLMTASAIFIVLWIGVTILAMVNLDANLFERAGSVGTVGLGLLTLLDAMVIDGGTYGETETGFFETAFSSLKSKLVWLSFLIPITTLQWGFGSIFFTCLFGAK